jgi:hypothetical protein
MAAAFVVNICFTLNYLYLHYGLFPAAAAILKNNMKILEKKQPQAGAFGY